MDFLGVTTGLNQAEDWFQSVHEKGRECATSIISHSWPFDQFGNVLIEYASAVAWHNIDRDDRLHPEDRQRTFAEIVNVALDNPAGRFRPEMLEILEFWKRSERNLEARCASDLSAMGPPPVGVISNDDGYDTLSVCFIRLFSMKYCKH